MKHYVIVGGSKGIGKATAELLAAEGHQITVFSRTPYEGPAHTIEWEEFNVLTDSWDDVMPENIDGLMYSVGSINLKPFRGLKPEVFEADFQLQVMGAIKALQAAQKNFNKGTIPSCVLFSTVAVQRGMPFHATVRKEEIYLKFGHLKNSDNFFWSDRLTDRQTLWFIGKLHFQKIV